MVTYNLKGKEKNSKKYYENAIKISKEIVENIVITGEDFLEDYMKYIVDNKVENLRSREEYCIEILLIGVLMLEYMDNGRAFMNKSVNLYVSLNGFRNSNERFKALVDKLRGILITKTLTKKKKGINNYTLYDFYLIIRWMEAVGDFEEELNRIKGWYLFLQSEDSEFVEEFLMYSEEISKWMCNLCENKFSDYLINVDNYLNNYKGKEDIIFCGRSKNQYYLNIIGAEIMNSVYKQSFISCNEKKVYLPACMKKNKGSCKSIKTNEGFKCMKCNKGCSVRTITLIGESKGFDSRIIPHQTSIFDIKVKNKIGVVGIACILNLLSGGWKAIRMGFTPQCVVLEYCGCAHHWCEKDIPTEINYSVFREKFIKK
ncbi:MAG: DUF116 domain-containing protein [Clostridium sp.]|nr:DUF116 domain-containing protein [Clostridium sp.]